MAVAVGEIAVELGMALLKGIAGTVGAGIFDSISPQSGVPDYFGEVYQEIRKLVKDEIEQIKIDEINGEINGIKDWVKNVYAPRKDGGASKHELSDMIQQRESDIAVHMIAVLREKSFAELGLGVFVIGAGMHLTLLQELALVDPLASSANESSYVESVKNYAEDYAAYVDATYDLVEKNRTDENNITRVKLTKRLVNVFLSQIEYDTTWKDKYLDKTYTDYTEWSDNTVWSNGTDDELLQRSEKNRNDHIEEVKPQLAKDLHDPKGVANLWRKLKEQTIPTQTVM